MPTTTPDFKTCVHASKYFSRMPMYGAAVHSSGGKPLPITGSVSMVNVIGTRYYVDVSKDTDGDGLSWETARNSLSAMLTDEWLRAICSAHQQVVHAYVRGGIITTAIQETTAFAGFLVVHDAVFEWSPDTTDLYPGTYYGAPPTVCRLNTGVLWHSCSFKLTLPEGVNGVQGVDRGTAPNTSWTAYNAYNTAYESTSVGISFAPMHNCTVEVIKPKGGKGADGVDAYIANGIVLDGVDGGHGGKGMQLDLRFTLVSDSTINVLLEGSGDGGKGGSSLPSYPGEGYNRECTGAGGAAVTDYGTYIRFGKTYNSTIHIELTPTSKSGDGGSLRWFKVTESSNGFGGAGMLQPYGGAGSDLGTDVGAVAVDCGTYMYGTTVNIVNDNSGVSAGIGSSLTPVNHTFTYTDGIAGYFKSLYTRVSSGSVRYRCTTITLTMAANTKHTHVAVIVPHYGNSRNGGVVSVRVNAEHAKIQHSSLNVDLQGGCGFVDEGEIVKGSYDLSPASAPVYVPPTCTLSLNGAKVDGFECTIRIKTPTKLPDGGLGYEHTQRNWLSGLYITQYVEGGTNIGLSHNGYDVLEYTESTDASYPSGYRDPADYGARINITLPGPVTAGYPCGGRTSGNRGIVVNAADGWHYVDVHGGNTASSSAGTATPEWVYDNLSAPAGARGLNADGTLGPIDSRGADKVHSTSVVAVTYSMGS